MQDVSSLPEYPRIETTCSLTVLKHHWQSNTIVLIDFLLGDAVYANLALVTVVGP